MNQEISPLGPYIHLSGVYQNLHGMEGGKWIFYPEEA